MKPFSAKKMSILVLMIILGLLSSPLGVIPARAAGVLYVMPGGTGDCSSWVSACDLQTALAAATSGDEIWVAAGTHKPAAGADRNATFQLKDGIAVYGGFAGAETARDQRDLAANLTILSGDIDNNDSQTPIITDLTTVTGNTTNSYHVITVMGASDVTLDGFIITAGNANGGSGCFGTDCGAGMYNIGSSPTLANLIFSGNSADFGGGMYNAYGSPTLTNVTFSSNYAEAYGGGMDNQYDSNPTFINATFSRNSAGMGGGLYNAGSNPTLINTTFSGNSASYGGGIYNSSSNSILTNVTFGGNSASASSYADGAGAIYNKNSNPQIRNAIFWGNTAPNEGAQIYNNNSSPIVSDSVIQDGCSRYSICTNIIRVDPRLGALDNHGGFTPTIPLLPGSSAINTGDDTACPSTDQRGLARPQGDHCDIGAFEFEIDYTGIYYAKPVASGLGDCHSWDNACTLQTALTTAIHGDEIWVAAGRHTPTTGTDRAATFQLKGGVAIYGGFAGTETARDQRNFVANQTVLSGDIDNNDSQTPVITDLSTVTGNTTNSSSVVSGATGATLDGFTITAGKTSGNVCPGTNCGAGMINYYSSPNLANLTFSGNSATWGGGMANYSSSPEITNVTFSGNSASWEGGGMWNSHSSKPVITNVTFRRNLAYDGGGMCNKDNSDPVMTNVAFSGNSAGRGGGGMANYSSNPVMTNVTFSGNSAKGGGGMYNHTSHTLILTNVTFSGNSATDNGGGMYNYSTSNSPTIRNTIFWGNTASTSGAQIYNYFPGSTPVVRDSIVQGGYVGGTNIITADPLLGTFGSYSDSLTETFPLLAGSSAIDAGNDAFCPVSDQRGLARPQGAHCDIGAFEYVETTAPETQIDTSPVNPNNSTEASFTFSSPDATATFECSLDGTVFTPCINPKDYSGLAEGAHTFRVRARDLSGNVDATAAFYVWLVDLTAPETQIDTSPANPTTSTEASFAFSSSDDTATFECSLDNEVFTACASPREYIGLADGSHTFAIRAKDPVGNLDPTPALYTWVIDLTAPETQINSSPAALSKSSSASFTFSSTDSAATFECSLDGSDYAACVNPKGYTGLADGSHIFTVRAKDLAGNLDTSPASYSWTIDATAPDTQIDSKPVTPSNSSNASFTFSSTDNTATFECSLDYATFAACTSPQNYTGLSAGSRNFRVRAKDPAGNLDASPASYTWTIDISAPDTQIDSRPPNPTSSSEASFTFSSPDSTATFECSLDGAAFVACTSPKNYTELESGLHSFVIRAKDPAGNLDSTPASYTWMIDTTHVAGVLYVTPNGTGDCSDWTKACTLQTALTNAFSGPQADEIWVAAGVHKPTTGSDREATFLLESDVNVYGGFAGTETARSQRNPATNLTILSGDIDNNDSQTPIITNLATVTGNASNSYHVVTGVTGAILDGFTITAGYAHGNSTNYYGAGMYNYNASPTLINLTFSGNSAFKNGGGIYNSYSNPTLTNVIFGGNSASSGGGVCNTSSNPVLMNVTFNDNKASFGGGISNNQSSSPTLTDITFSNNSATAYGGGIYNSSSNPALTNVTFSNNSATVYGGGMHNFSSNPTLMDITFSDNSAGTGGGMYNSSGNPVLTNGTFSGNTAEKGGGIYNIYSNPILTNVTFSGNSASSFGGGLYNDASNPVLTSVTFSGNLAFNSGGSVSNSGYSRLQIRNAILWNNHAPTGAQIDTPYGFVTMSDSVIQGGCPAGSTCTNIITTDPLLGILGNYGGFTQTIPILAGSSAIDAGNDAVCPATDQRGIARPQGAGCDIGAFEYVVPLGAFEKLVPTDAEVDTSLSLTLSWQPSSGATSYEYCYSSAPGPCIKWNSIGGYTSVTLDGLAPNYTYYWQVRAVNAGGTAEADDGSWWSFTTTAAPICTWPAYTPPASATFGDVPMAVGHWSWVERLSNSTITAGCGEGNFCPLTEVNRAQMAIFLLRSKHCGSSYTPPAVGDSTGFGDVPLTATYAPWVKQLSVEGITAGCGNGNFCPLQVVTRAQMAIFLLRAKHGATYSPPAVGASTGFGDVPLDATYAAWVKQLAAEGVTTGCGNGNFCPLQNVNRAQMATFLVRAFGLP